MAFFLGLQIENPEIYEIEIPITLDAIFFSANLWLRWNLKQSCKPREDLSNDMWQDPYTHVNQGDSWLLIVEG